MAVKKKKKKAMRKLPRANVNNSQDKILYEKHYVQKCIFLDSLYNKEED